MERQQDNFTRTRFSRNYMNSNSPALINEYPYECGIYVSVYDGVLEKAGP